MAIVVTFPWNDYQKGAQRATLVAEVSGVTSAIAAAAACKIDRGLGHPDDGDFICDDWDSAKLSPIDFWRLYFTFSSSVGGTTATPNRLTFDPALRSEPIDRDDDGNPIVNSALDPNDPPIQTDFITLGFTVVRSENGPFRPAKAMPYMRRVNKAPCTIMGMTFAAGQVLCKTIAPVGEVTLKTRRIDVAYNFEAREEGWDARVLDQGFRGVVLRQGRTGPQPTEIFNPPDPTQPNSIKPVQISVPVRLNGKGKPIEKAFTDRYGDELGELNSSPKGARVETAPGNIAVFLNWKTRPRADLNKLGL